MEYTHESDLERALEPSSLHCSHERIFGGTERENASMRCRFYAKMLDNNKVSKSVNIYERGDDIYKSYLAV